MLIGIDPGHGGRDSGAVSPVRPELGDQLYTEEADITLAISKKVQLVLWTAGIDVYMTRTNDVYEDLLTRSSCINNMKCDLAVSIHINSVADASPDYIATFVQATGGQAEQLAIKVQGRLAQATGWEDAGVIVKNLHMTRETKMPAILVELGFLSNPGEERQLNEPAVQGKIAAAIAKGILDYIGVEEVREMNIDEALAILKDKGIISSPDYWKMAAGCVQYLSNLLIAVANYIK